MQFIHNAVLEFTVHKPSAAETLATGGHIEHFPHSRASKVAVLKRQMMREWRGVGPPTR